MPTQFMRRIEAAVLSVDDLQFIETTQMVRPMRWSDYTYPWREKIQNEAQQLAAFPEVMPWAIIDSRIADLARRFFQSHDDCITVGFRRLEDIVRKRTGLQEHGVKLMQQAFLSDASPLNWTVSDPSEQKGRAQLFVGSFMAYRNPRAHREIDSQGIRPLAEFLMLNQLYLLERQAVTTE